MNNFFISIGRKLAEKFPDLSSSNQPEDNPNATGSGFSFQLISESFVRDAIKRLKPNKATGLDKISARLLKDSGHTSIGIGIGIGLLKLHIAASKAELHEITV